MSGQDFYFILILNLQPGQVLTEKGYVFTKWLNESDLQFSIPNNNAKSIPKKIIIEAKNSYNEGIVINNDWLVQRNCNRGWCLAEVLNELFELYQ